MCVISGMNCELEFIREIILHFEVVQQMLVHELNSYFALHTFDCARLHNLFDNRDDVGVLRSGKFLCVRKSALVRFALIFHSALSAQPFHFCVIQRLHPLSLLVFIFCSLISRNHAINPNS